MCERKEGLNHGNEGPRIMVELIPDSVAMRLAKAVYEATLKWVMEQEALKNSHNEKAQP